MLLDWTFAADIAAVRAASPGGAGYDLLLGADVAYGQQALPALFSCAAQLLARVPAAAFLLGESLIAWLDGGVAPPLSELLISVSAPSLQCPDAKDATCMQAMCPEPRSSTGRCRLRRRAWG